MATATLGPGEVLLEISASAIEPAPIASATYRIWVQTNGATQAAADAERDRVIAQVQRAARSAGAGAADIVVEHSEVRMMQMVDVEGPGQPDAEPQPSAAATVRATLRNASNFESFGEAVTAAGATMSGQPELTPGDDSAAKRTARNRALTAARADADAYAAALNMRVVRMARVTERAGPDFLGMMLGGMTGQGMGGLERWIEGRNPQAIPVPVFLGVDFILAPR